MGLAPQTRTLGEASKPKSDFRPIKLGTAPILDPTRPVPPGVVFMSTSELAALDDAMSCCGRYTLQNTQHHSIAGVTSDGHSIFAVHSKFGGRNLVSIGAFDPLGTPVVPTSEHRATLLKFVPKSEKIIVMDAKASGALGFRTNGTNPRGGVYVGNRTMVFDLGFTISDDPSWSIDGDASITTDWDGRVKSQAYGLKGRYEDASLSARMERSGTQTTHIVEAAYDRFTLGARQTSGGASRNRQVTAGWRVARNATISVYWKPDVRPPTSAPLPKTFSIRDQPAFEDYSNYGLTFKIEL